MFFVCCGIQLSLRPLSFVYRDLLLYNGVNCSVYKLSTMDLGKGQLLASI